MSQARVAFSTTAISVPVAMQQGGKRVINVFHAVMRFGFGLVAADLAPRRSRQRGLERRY